VKLTVVIEETRPGWWTATADVGRDKASGDGPTEEAALESLRIAVAASRRRHVHDPFRCPAHVPGCGCPDLEGYVCNPYCDLEYCPAGLEVMPGDPRVSS
jgi:hypothetical protein